MPHRPDAEALTGDSAIRKCMLGDIGIAYRRHGVGCPLVLVHGLAEDGASWVPVVAHLPGDLIVYAPDLRGHGGTDAGQGQGSIAQLAADLTAFLEQVSGPAVCAGFSLGGVVVLEAALARPDLVRKAIVIGTSSKVGRAAAGFFAERIGQIGTDMEAFRKALTADTDAQIVRQRAAVARVAAQRIAAVGDGAGYVNAARAMIGMAAAPMTGRLGGIRVPVHIVQGAEDVFCPQRAADILCEAMPQAGFSEITGAGHLMSVDQPERLAREIAYAAEGCTRKPDDKGDGE